MRIGHRPRRHQDRRHRAADASGVERTRQRIDTPQGPYEETIEAIRALVAQLEANVGERCSVGVATPGAISPASGLIKNAN